MFQVQLICLIELGFHQSYDILSKLSKYNDFANIMLVKSEIKHINMHITASKDEKN